MSLPRYPNMHRSGFIPTIFDIRADVGMNPDLQNREVRA